MINDAFAKEKREVYSMSNASSTGLFEEFADPLDESYIPERVQKIILNVASRDPTEWTYRKLVYESMKTSFGLYSVTEYNRALRALLAGQTTYGLVGVGGNRLRKDNNWKVDDDLRLRFVPE